MGKHNVDSTKEVKLLGLAIDHKLNFNSHISTLCTTASKKLKCLHRIRNYISIPQAKILCNAYIYSTFNYCSLIWMFCNKIANNKINKIHLRTLRTIYLNDEATLNELLKNDNSESIHSKHIKVLLVEIFKSLSNLNPSFMWNVLNKKTIPYSLRTSNLLTLPATNTKRFGTNSIVFKVQFFGIHYQIYTKTKLRLSNLKLNLKIGMVNIALVNYVRYELNFMSYIYIIYFT